MAKARNNCPSMHPKERIGYLVSCERQRHRKRRKKDAHFEDNNNIKKTRRRTPVSGEEGETNQRQERPEGAAERGREKGLEPAEVEILEREK